MKRRLPPFAAVKAFEAAARHCNFQLAAQELGISASAVSHQVKSLEDFLATALFLRQNNRLILRPEGQAYLEQLSEALDLIERATENLVRTSGRGQLTVNLFPSLADVWLIPRLGNFHQKNADIAIRLNTSDLSGGVLDREADFALSYMPLHDVAGGACVLFADETIPVVAPEYLEKHGPLDRPEDLVGHPLITSLSEDDEWGFWFRAMSVTENGTRETVEFDMCSSCQAAAKEGLGVAMGRRPYVDDDLVNGDLVVPMAGKVATGYCLAMTPTLRGESLPYLARFSDWLNDASQGSERLWRTIS